MTKLLERAVEVMRRMAPATQDNFAQAILTMSEAAPDAIEPEHLPYVLEGLAQIERGEFATDEEVEAAFRTFER